MSLAQWWSEARSIGERERFLTAARRRACPKGAPLLVSQRMLARVAWRGRVIRIVPHAGLLIGALYAPSGIVTGTESTAWLFGQFAVFAFLLTNWVAYGPRLTVTHDVDRLLLPSLSGLTLFRWLRVLPDHLLIGACWAGTVWSLSGPLAGGGDLTYLAAVFLAPVYLTTQWHARDRTNASLTAWRAWFVHAVTHLPALALVAAAPFWHDGPGPTGVGAALLIWFAIGTPVALDYVLRHGPGPGTGLKLPTPELTTDTDVDATLPRTHRGRRSLSANMWSLRFNRLRPVWSTLSHRPWVVLLLPLWSLTGFPGLWLAAAAVWFAGDAPSLLLAAVAVTLSGFSEYHPDQRILNLGVDLRHLARHRLSQTLVFGELPTVLTALIVAGLLGMTPERLTTVGLIAGFALWSTGWFGLMGREKLGMTLDAIMVLAVIVTAAVGVSITVGTGLAIAAGGLGLLGVLRILSRSEVELRTEMRQRLLGEERINRAYGMQLY